MSCQRHHSFHYRFIGVMFWAFPYLLWQVFGNISGFFVGVVLAIVLTVMFQTVVSRNNWSSTPAFRRPARTTERSTYSQETAYRPYQSGYAGSIHGEQPAYQPTQLQPQYEEMQVPYPDAGTVSPGTPPDGATATISDLAPIERQTCLPAP